MASSSKKHRRKKSVAKHKRSHRHASDTTKRHAGKKTTETEVLSRPVEAKPAHKHARNTTPPAEAVMTDLPPIPAPTRSHSVRAGFVVLCVLLAGTLGVGLVMTITNLTSGVGRIMPSQSYVGNITSQMQALKISMASFERQQTDDEIQVVSSATLDQRLLEVNASIEAGDTRSAKQQITAMRHDLADWQTQLAARAHQKIATGDDHSRAINVPILIYHYMPPNFEAILQHLQSHGYTTVTLAQVARALHDQGSLPSKPVVITFDDGFANQMTAFELLQKYQMRATYYIIDGGSRSRWCIGAGRRSGDPAQPPQGCGDAYLTWDQVRQLDHSGIITIGSHTVDHESLATVTPNEQRYQIFEGKKELEAQLGHPVTDFAYPYGTFTATTIGLVGEAGFSTAVTTQVGQTETLTGILTMPRVRDAFALQ